MGKHCKTTVTIEYNYFFTLLTSCETFVPMNEFNGPWDYFVAAISCAGIMIFVWRA